MKNIKGVLVDNLSGFCKNFVVLFIAFFAVAVLGLGGWTAYGLIGFVGEILFDDGAEWGFAVFLIAFSVMLNILMYRVGGKFVTKLGFEILTVISMLIVPALLYAFFTWPFKECNVDYTIHEVFSDMFIPIFNLYDYSYNYQIKFYTAFNLFELVLITAPYISMALGAKHTDVIKHEG